MVLLPEPDQDGERIDAFLARAYPEYSRSFFQKLIKQGFVTRKSQPLGQNDHVHIGDQLNVYVPDITKVAPELPVIYEDDDVVVVNKPCGMLTHAKGALLDEPTVADFVRPRTTAGQDTNRPGIVHRLDRATSGILIAAKNPAAQTWLQRQFSDRKVKKTYIALVKGVPKEAAAIIKLPIERNPKKPQMFRVGGNGKPAETSYETLRSFTGRTQLQLKPLTGRTHQLRVHMAYLGCPIVGDPVYGRPEPALGRMFLHAAELELTLPNRTRQTFRAPLPKELQAYLDSLQ